MLRKGDVLKGRYLVLQKIGSGGHGTVFRARDRARNRLVAIKVLRSDLAENADFVRRFHREARIAALLDSRHVVRVLETDHVRLRNEHVDFQVTEYVHGPTLQHLLSRKGRFSAVEAIGIAIQIARALEEAHDKGVLHHDIKPKNIFIGEDETVKVGDFGIARAVDFPTTRDDTAAGTPTYMSPERCRGPQEEVDVRSDIYSLGVVVYQMLAGRPPFQGDSTSSICYKHIHDTPAPLRDLIPALPERLQELVHRCLQKDPGDRFQTPRELRRALEELGGAERADGVGAVPRRKRERGRRDGLPPSIPASPAATSPTWWRKFRPSRAGTMAGMSIVLVLVVGIGLAYVLSRPDNPVATQPTVSPTGTGPGVEAPAEPVVAYVGDDGNLHVASETGEDLAKLTNDGRAIQPSWSPDGRRLAYVYVKGVDSSDTAITELAIVNWDGSGARTVAAAGVYESGAQQRRTVLRNPRWSPDGSAIYYLEDLGQHETHLNRLILAPDALSSKIEEDLVDPSVLFGEGAYLESFDVHPGDGTIVYQGCRAAGPRGCGLGLQSPPGVASRTAVLIPIQDGDSYSFPAWSLDGKEIGLYAYTGGAPRIMVIDAVGGDLREQSYTEQNPETVKNRFWPTLTALPEGGFAYESDDEIRISGWGDTPSGTTIAGQHPAVFPGSGYRRGTPAWPGVEQLDCGSWWKGEYFANDGFGGKPTMVRCDRQIDFNWEDGSGPWLPMPADGFSVRWTGRVYVSESGAYTFRTFTDDGVRLWVDDKKVIDEWYRQQEEHKKDIDVGQGEHDVRMQFYDEHLGAIAQLSWTKVEPTPTPTPEPTPSPTSTATRTPAQTAKPTPSPAHLPDLTITALRWEPANLVAGKVVTNWCAVVKNRGSDFTSYVSPALDITVDGAKIVGPAHQPIGQLRAGKTREVCLPAAMWNGPWKFSEGPHTVVAEIDSDNQVQEGDEGNNTFTIGLTVGPP